jgi:hypothetical protein
VPAIEQKLDALATSVDARFDTVDARFDEVNEPEVQPVRSLERNALADRAADSMRRNEHPLLARDMRSAEIRELRDERLAHTFTAESPLSTHPAIPAAEHCAFHSSTLNCPVARR